MTVNVYSEDCALPYTPSSAVTGGDVVVQGNLVGIATRDIAANILGSIQVEGVYTFPKATGALTAGQKVYWDSANSNVSRLSGVGPLVGRVVTAVASGATTVNVLLTPDAHKSLAYSSEAASTAVSNDTAETNFDTYVTLPANSLAPGDVIRVRAQVIATSTNSTDTLTLKLKLGTTTIVSTAAVDVANNDIGFIDFDIVIRTDGASGTMVGAGVQGLGVPGTVTAKPALLASTAIDTTASKVVAVSATWSNASASNSCRLDVLNVQVLKK